MSAEFVNNGKTYRAFYFKDRNEVGNYYDPSGNSLRKQFLRSPLRYRRISSHFSYRPLHPILKIFRPHLGIDYAARPGTPVQAIGSRIVTFLGVKGDPGKLARIRHNHTYSTTYGHLQGFAEGLNLGDCVK